MNELIFFISFLVFIFAILLFDLGVFHKGSHIVKAKEALGWTAIWISFALIFAALLYFHGDLIHGIDTQEKLNQIIKLHHHPIDVSGLTFEDGLALYRSNLSIEFLTGYVIEYSLSIDNLFVILLVFMSFKVEKENYKKVLMWGILGAIVMRFIFIFFSAAIIQQFEWILYVFGGFLVFSGGKMLWNMNKEEKIDAEHHPVVRFASKYFNVLPTFSKDRFFVKLNGKKYITPLFLVVLVVEFSDVIFAVDSVPAIFSVTKEQYIVFFSNIFAILGLRSLFFVLSNFMGKFRLLKPGLSILLMFIGFKMLFEKFLHEHGFTTSHSLLIVVGILTISIVGSLILPEKQKSPKA